MKEMVTIQMQQLYNTGDEKLKPNTIIMNLAIAVWAKNSEGLIRALWVEMLLQLMENVMKQQMMMILNGLHSHTTL